MSVWLGLVTETTPMGWLTPDPRISSERPAWLDAANWRDQLHALTDGDVEWIEQHWQMAGAPEVDMSWITTERIR